MSNKPLQGQSCLQVVYLHTEEAPWALFDTLSSALSNNKLDLHIKQLNNQRLHMNLEHIRLTLNKLSILEKQINKEITHLQLKINSILLNKSAVDPSLIDKLNELRNNLVEICEIRDDLL